MERHKDRVFKHLVPFQRVLLYFLSVSSSHIFLQLDTHLPLSVLLLLYLPLPFAVEDNVIGAYSQLWGKLHYFQSKVKKCTKDGKALKPFVCLLLQNTLNRCIFYCQSCSLLTNSTNEEVKVSLWFKKNVKKATFCKRRERELPFCTQPLPGPALITNQKWSVKTDSATWSGLTLAPLSWWPCSA